MVGVIGVTGATGHVGGAVARSLADAGIPQRLVVRDPTRCPALPGAEVVIAEYGDGPAVQEALRGCSTLLMVSAAETERRLEEHVTFIDAAAAVGVEHVVYTSFYRAAADATFTLARDHWHTEQHIRRRGQRFTFLRDNLYADVLPLFIGDDGALRGPAGHGRLSAVTRGDVAEVAATVLRSPERYVDVTLDLTGPEALTMDQVADILTQRLGREVRYVEETVQEAHRSRARWDPPSWQMDAWVSTYTAIAAGEMDGVSNDVELVTGHQATSLQAMPLT